MEKQKRIVSIFLIIIMVLSPSLSSVSAASMNGKDASRYSTEISTIENDIAENSTTDRSTTLYSTAGNSSDANSISESNKTESNNENIVVTVRFETNGGSLSTLQKEVNYGSCYGTLSTPMRDGYTFGGWYTVDNGDVQVNETSIVEHRENHTLYARWNPIQVMLYFNGNGGNITETQKEVSYGKTYGALPIPTNKDYVFKGWYTSMVGGEEISPEKVVNITSSIMLYARWGGENVTITFDPNGGTVSTIHKLVKYADNYGELPIPEKSGYNFLGWHVSGKEEIINATSIVQIKAEHTLYAKWSKDSYNISFFTNGGNFDKTYNTTVFVGGIYGTLPTPEKEGHIFLGWFDSDASNARQVFATGEFNSTKPVTLYAHWKAKEHKVHLKGNGAVLSNDTIIVSYGSTYDKLPTPTMENYTFEGWYTHPIDGTQITTYTLVKTNVEEVLYAHWTGNPQTVYFNANGGNSSTESKEVYYGRNYGTLPTPSRTGYVFDGWYSSLGGGENITTEDTVRITAALTLYAHWTVKQPAITFDGNGGEVIANGEKIDNYTFPLAYGSTYGILPEAVREGYTFAGWYTSATGGSEIYSSSVNTATISDTIYAHWNGNVYSVQFNANGGTVSTATLNYTYGENYGYLPTPEKENYTFSGWYTEETGGTKILDSTTVRILGMQTLYAHWTGVRSTVYFDPCGGATTSSIIVYYYDTYGTLPIPTKTGYVFLGWYTDSVGGSQIVEKNIVKTTTNQILYAHWKVKTLVVTLDFNGTGGSNSTKVLNYGDSYGALPTLSRPGYTFTGWYTSSSGGTLVTPDKVVSANNNHKIYAHWEGDSFYIYFDATGGTVTETSRYVTNGKLYGTFKVPRRTGYSFGGWYTKVSGGVKAVSDHKVNLSGTSTLYAHWTKEVYTVSYVANGGTVETANTSILKGTSYSDFPIPERDGYTFTGWYSESGDSGTLITYVTAADTLYAHWSGNPTEIIFDGNGGIPTEASRAVRYGDSYGTLPTASKPYYTFSGWYTEPEGGYIRNYNSVVNFTEPVILYAHYKGISAKVYYASCGGSDINTTKTVYCGSEYGVLSVPTRTGYSFDGWYTLPDGGDLITSQTIVEATYDHTLYAHWSIYKPTITFQANGGRVIENGYKVPVMKVIKTYGDYYGALPVATRPGYTFDGWSTSSAGATRVTESTIVNVTVSDTLYARWIGNTYAVNFDANGGDVSQNSSIFTYGIEYGTLPTPVWNGYSFTGWYTEVTGGSKVTASNIVDILGTQTLYARWEEDTVNVTYNGNGGTMYINETTVSSTTRTLHYKGTYGNTSGVLPAPSRAGYLFTGWFTDAEGGNEITLGTEVNITEKQTLYAHWILKGIPVFFDENGGNPIGDTMEVNYGGTFGPLPTPTRANYSFLGWFRGETGNSQVNEGTSVTTSYEITLYAHWAPTSLVVTLDSGGGNIGVTSISTTFEGTYGTLPVPTRTKYSFAGWYTEAVGGHQITNYDVVIIPSNHTLYAHWIENDAAVTFLSNGYSLPNKYVKNNAPYGELPAPERTGYFFDGWYTQESNGSRVSATDIANITSDYQTLYAGWVAKTPTVIFYANGGNVNQATKRATYNAPYGELPIPTLAHYTFDGWFTSLNGTTKVTEATINTMTDTQLLYAHWIPDNYTVSYDANGGTVSISSNTVIYDGSYGTLPTPTFTGYDFLGWYTAAVGGALVNAVTKVTIGENHTLYAHWKAKPCTVTLDPTGGTLDNTEIIIDQHGAYGELPKPTRVGYGFSGWYTAKDGGTLVNATDKVPAISAVILYAHWTEKNLTVTFDANGGVVNTGSISVPFGGVYGELPVPTKEYWMFDGWYTEPEGGIQVIEIDTADSEDSFTLYAHWILKGEVTETEEELLAEYYDEYLEKRILPVLIENGRDITNIKDIALDEDYDGDGLTLDQEYRNNTDPFDSDTDADRLSDYAEVMVYGTDPFQFDTDGDGMSDQTEVTLGLNPLSTDTDADGILDSSESMTQSLDLELTEVVDINQTLVKPSIEITGAGDYYGKLYAEPIRDNLIIDGLGCVVGNAFDFLHNDSLTFEKSTLSFTVNSTVTQSIPVEDLSIAYYDFDNETLQLLDTTYTASMETVTGSAIVANSSQGATNSSEAVSGGAIQASAATGGAITYKLSAEVNHYSAFMVVNKTLVNPSGNNNRNVALQSTGTFLIRLSNGRYVRVMKDPSLGDRSVDSDGDGRCDIDELGFRYNVWLSESSSQPAETWTFHTDPSNKDTDADGIPDNRDPVTNARFNIDLDRHQYKPYNMITRRDNCFVDVKFNKYPYCTLNAKGDYVVQVEKWLLNLGLINKVDGKYEIRDVYAVAYLQKKYNVGSNGIIDNKTYGLLWALDEINQHKHDVELGRKTEAQLDAYNASVMYQSVQTRYQNPDYTQDYYLAYYNMTLNYMLFGAESLQFALSMFPNADSVNVAKFLYDLCFYKKGDKDKIAADLVALGVDVSFAYLDEIIDVAKLATRTVAARTAVASSKLKYSLKYSVEEIGYQIKRVISRSGNRTQVELVGGYRCYIDELKDIEESARPKYNEIIEGIWKYSGKSSDDITKYYFSKVARRTKVTGKYSGSASEILRAELKNAGVVPPPYSNQAHHIIPEGMDIPELNEVRALMKKYGVDLNSASNGVFLPASPNLPHAGSATVHRGSHTIEYARYVAKAIIDVEPQSADDIVDVLNSLRKKLLNGTLKLNSLS